MTNITRRIYISVLHKVYMNEIYILIYIIGKTPTDFISTRREMS